MAMTPEMLNVLLNISEQGGIPMDDVEEVVEMTMDDILKQAKTDEGYSQYASLLSMQAHINHSSTTMPDKLQDYYRDKVLDSIPGDLVVFRSDKERVELLDLFFPPDWKGQGTPIDILKEGTVPLTDVRIRFEEDDNLGDIRVVIFPDYQKRLEDDQNMAIVGAYLIYPKDKKAAKRRVFMGLLEVMPDSDFIVDSGLVGWIGQRPDAYVKRLIAQIMNPLSFHMLLAPFLLAWYSIQLTLLNPPTREVYIRVREQTTTSCKTYYGKRNKVKYVKKVILNPEDLLPKVDDGTGTKRKMRCPYWRVIGHWRQYKSGKRIFIKGYWKGPNRLFIPKGTESAMRERVLAVDEEAIKRE